MLSTRLHALLLAPTLALALPIPPAAATLAPATTTAIDVDVQLDQADDAALADRIRGDMVRTLNTEGVAVTKSAGDDEATIEVSVRWNADDNHEIAMIVQTPEGPKTPEGSPWVCEVCKEAQLMAKIGEVTPAALELLPPSADDPAATPPDPSHGDPPPHDAGGRAPLGTMGKAGIGVLAVGGVALVGGIVLAVLGKRESAGDDRAETEITNYRPAGIGLVAGGTAALVTGAILLAIDRKRARRSKSALAPFATPHTAGLAITGRF
jgi:hypothetical protein